jgi:hypothetical protein
MPKLGDDHRTAFSERQQGRWCTYIPHPLLTSLPLRPLLPAGRKFCKITENRPKKANKWPGKLAAVRPPILDESGRKKYIMKNMFFCMKCWAFKEIVFANFSELNFQNMPCLCLFYPSLLWKRSFEKMQNFFPIWPNIFTKFADNSFWDLATVVASVPL